jgi:hypothetical protein|tara:strand:+ start:883 stop:1065 length:183 start_codon:yes stop_codon:yes gene_type:complete
MTNEERIEERLIDAHNRGYYDDVIKRITELKDTHPKMNIYDRYDQACNEYKQKWKLINNQ